MRDWELNEPVIAALQARLASGLPAALAAIRAELPADEAAALADPVQVFDYAPPPSALTGYPAVGLTDVESVALDDTGSSVTGEHHVGIVAYVHSTDHRLMVWTLRRYMQAIAKVALAGRVLGTGSQDGAWGVGWMRYVPGDVLADEEPDPHQLTTWGTLVVWARREELN